METINRRIDELGRVVLPYEIREKLSIKAKDTLHLVVDTNRIILERGQEVDELGRVIIPKQVRKILGIEEKEMLEIQVVDNKIILSKQEPKEE